MSDQKMITIQLAVIGMIGFFVIGTLAGLHITEKNSQGDNAFGEYNDAYAVHNAGDKLEFSSQEGEKILVGCFSKVIDNTYKIRYNSETDHLTLLKTKDGGINAFYGDEFSKCIVDEDTEYHREYNTQEMEMHNGDILHYRLNQINGDWRVGNTWIEKVNSTE